MDDSINGGVIVSDLESFGVTANFDGIKSQDLERRSSW